MEICANNVDDDCDGLLDEADVYGDCVGDVPCDGPGDAAVAQCDGTCRMRGLPVDLGQRGMYVGPHEAARIRSDEGGSADLVFSVLFDSQREANDYYGLMGPGGEERPHLRDVSPGFRHSFSDRLIMKTDAAGVAKLVTWEHARGRTMFYRRSTVGADWAAEPGVNAYLKRSGSTWRLITPSGDVIDFVEGPSTWLHPRPAIDTTEYHVRMKRLYPGGSAARSVLFLYEDEDKDDIAPFDADKIPEPACTDLVPGATNNNCTTSRGLLVKAGVVFGAASPFGHGPSFEFQYTYGGGGTSPQQFLISDIRGGATRIDGGTVVSMATLSYTSGTPRRLEKLTTRVACTATNDSCTIAKYAFDADGSLTSVKRPATLASGGSAILLDEETFSYGVGLVTAHASVGTVLSFTAGSTDPDTKVTTMQWTRNGAPFDFRFDAQGNPLTCSDGSCGYSGEDKTYQLTDLMPAPFTLGPQAVKNADGTWTFRRYTERGNVDFECTLVPTSATTDPQCMLWDSTGAVSISSGTMRSLVRRYYDIVGDFDRYGRERLRVVASYDPDTVNTSLAFPTSASSWLTPSADLSSCTTLTPTSGVHKYDVTVYDYSSDGDATPNETSFSSLSIPDLLPLRVNRAAVSDGSTGTQRSCTIMVRDDQGRVTTTRELASGALRREALFSYFAIPADQTMSSGRLSSVTRYRTLGAATDPIVTMSACTASTRYDMEGRLACFEVPQASGSSMTFSEYLAPGNTVYAERRLTQVSGGGTTVSSYANELASGVVFESGTGDGATGGAAEGNRVRRLFDATGYAATQTTIGAVEHYDSSLSSSGLVWKSTDTHNSYGFPVTSRVYQGSSTLRSRQDRTQIDEDGRTELLRQWVTSTSSVSTGYSYAAPGWDVLTDVWEADGDHAEYEYGGLADWPESFGRKVRTRRAGNTVQEMTYTRDGAVRDVLGLAGTAIPAGSYTYDALRRLKREDRRTVGQAVEYSWLDDSRVSRKVVKDANGIIVEGVRYGYDGLGRLTSTTALAGAIQQTVRTIKYDDKGSFAGTWNDVTMTSDFNRGRVAYDEDESGATFYEYDGGGRITAIIRYEGALSGWNPTANPLRVTRFQYGNAGELTTLTYPSGRTVTYSYGNDRERPTSLMTSTLGTVASGITYEPSGTPSFWKFEGTTGRDRTVSRDGLGRVTRLLDRYGFSTWSDVAYTYDADGDVLTETDSSPVGTWLRSITTAPQSRTYTYETSRQKDILKSWVDDGTAESVVYKSDGRRDTETDSPSTFTYRYSSTYPERMLSKTSGSVTSGQEVIYSYGSSNAGRIAGIDSSANGTTDVTLGYGPQGNVATRTTSSGTYTDKYDHDMRLVGIDDPTGSNRRFRYAFGRAPLEETRTTTSGTWRYETIYLAGEAIAQVADSPTASPALRNFHTDRMGIVRKTATTSGTSLYRVVFDAWGGTNSVAGSAPIDNNLDPMPSVGWRYPGQYNTGSNGWRQYLSLTGQYASPEPLHAMELGVVDGTTFVYELDLEVGAAGVAFGFANPATFPANVDDAIGPAAFAYAAARPLLYIDPTGLSKSEGIPGDDIAYRELREAMKDAEKSGVRKRLLEVGEKWQKWCVANPKSAQRCAKIKGWVKLAKKGQLPGFFLGLCLSSWDCTCAKFPETCESILRDTACAGEP